MLETLRNLWFRDPDNRMFSSMMLPRAFVLAIVFVGVFVASDELSVVADCGYYNYNEIKACDDADITIYLPKSQASHSQA